MKIKRALAFLLIFFLLISNSLLLIPTPVFAASWWDSDWDYRFQYTIDNSNVGETLTDFPLHIDLTNDAPANFWTHVDSDGADIRIIDEDDSTNLSSQAHLEGWNYSNSQGHIWVKRTIAASGNSESVYIYYGNSAASTAFSDTTKQATYNDNYKAVWHLDESPNDDVAGHLDATSNNNDGTPKNFQDGGGGTTNATGKIGGADDFDGDDDYVNVSYNNSLDVPELTLIAWIYPHTRDCSGGRRIIAAKENFPNPGWEMSVCDTLQIAAYINGAWRGWYNAGTIASPNAWYHVAMTYDGTDLKGWVNNQPTTVYSSGGTLGNSAVPFIIGERYAAYEQEFDGIIDEVRISNTNRSAEWIEFAYLSDSGGGGTAGSEEIGNTAPSTPTIDNYNNGSWTTDNTPSLQFDLSDPDSGDIVKYQIQIDDNSDFSSTAVDYTEPSGSAVPRNNVTYTPSALADGSYYWRVKGIDDSSAESSWATANSGSIAFKVDTVSPASFTPTANPSSWNQDTTPTITFSTTDATSGIDHYEVKIGSGGTYATQSSPYTLPAQSDGQQTVYVKAIDGAGNETEASVQIYVDATAPASFDLNSPGNNSYTNNERPTFKWKAASTPDATSGLSKYKLEISSVTLSGAKDPLQITIDDIPTSGTADVASSRYVIHFGGFSDSDSTNNYISVYTKSSSDWSSSENDGKLKEGKITWKVKAQDNAGNEREQSNNLYVDRTEPSTEVNQINDTAGDHTGSPLQYATTDTTPTIYGKIIDSLAGIGSDDDYWVASGPKEVEIKIEKENYLLGSYSLHTSATVNLTESYWTTDGVKITDNSKNTSNKYSPFEYTLSEGLSLGTYKITLIGKDKADNTGSTIFNLKITTLDLITTPEEKKVIEEELKGLKPEEKEKIKEQLEITKPQEVTPTPLQARIFKPLSGMIGFFRNTIAGIGNFTKSIFQYVKEVASLGAQTLTEGLSRPDKLASRLNEWFYYAKISFGEIVFDKEPTKIVEIKVLEVGETYAVVFWKTNHHTKNNKVNYGENLSYGNQIFAPDREREHIAKIANLKPNTKYYFEVMSQNKNYIYDSFHEFTTLP